MNEQQKTSQIVVEIDFEQVLLFDKSSASEEKMVLLNKYCGEDVV